MTRQIRLVEHARTHRNIESRIYFPYLLPGERFEQEELGIQIQVYEGFHPLLAKDIADNVMYALTRPLNVQVSDMIVLANAQASARQVSRNTFELPKELCTTLDE